MVAAAVFLLLGACGLGTGVQEWSNGRTKSVVRATLIALPLLLVFGVLLGSADPVFGSLFRLPNIDFGTVISHLVVAGFFTWVVGGWLYGALLYDRPSPRLREGMPITLGSIDVTIVLGGLVALFGLFVSVQIGWLFGGERLVRATTGLGYAQYARHGFFELVWVSLLVLPVLLATRSALREDDGIAVRRHRLLSIPIIALIGGIMASALGRMGLYVHYYGLSMDRLFATVFMFWLAIVFAWFGVTVLRGRTRDFAAGMTITGFLTLAALGSVNPEALVARVNVSRANVALSVGDSLNTPSAQSNSEPQSNASPIDYAYLTSGLSGDAVGHVVGALVANPISPIGSPARLTEVKARCDAVRSLFGRYGSGQVHWNLQGFDNDWRRWNVGASEAHRVMRASEQELRAVTCLDESGEMPFGDRDRRPARPGEQGYAEPRTH
jgi:heme A synthase